MLAYEEVLKEDWYYDSDDGCEQWTRGTYEEIKVFNFYAYDTEVDEEQFDLDEVPHFYVVHCKSCDDRYGVNGHPLIQLCAGDSVWVCGKCEEWYVGESEAVDCCQEDDE